MKNCLLIILTTLVSSGQAQTILSQDPMSKGTWSYKNGKPTAVNFDYGTKLTVEDLKNLSEFDTLENLQMGFSGIDSEYVTIEGDVINLSRLQNLQTVHLNKDGIVDNDLMFLAKLPRIRELEFNAKNGEGGCSDRCAKYVSSATTLRELRIYNGQFTDRFIDLITRKLSDLEVLILSSPHLTDESLRLVAQRCKKLKRLSLRSSKFTDAGLKQLEKLPHLKQRW